MKPPQQPRRRRPIYNEAMGRALKVRRAEQGIGRRELAERAGISYSYLAEIENGNKPPSSQVLIALSEALGLRPSELHAAADSLQYQTPGESSISPRLSNIAESAQRAWSPAPANYRMAMQPQFDELTNKSTPDPADRQAILAQLIEMLERMSDDDLEMVLRIARRLGA